MIAELPEKYGKYWKELLAIAEAIYEEEERHVDPPIEDEAIVQEMTAEGLLESEENCITIRQDLLPGVIAWHLVESAIRTWKDVEGWTRFLREISHKEWRIFRERKRIGGDLLVLLQKEKGHNIFQRARQLAEEDLDRDELQASKYGAMSYALHGALPRLDNRAGRTH